MSKKESWQPCPRCGSKKVKQSSKLAVFMVGLCSLSFSMWLIIFPFLGFSLMILGLLMMIAAPFLKNSLRCEDCGKTWVYTENTNNVI